MELARRGGEQGELRGVVKVSVECGGTRGGSDVSQGDRAGEGRGCLPCLFSISGNVPGCNGESRRYPGGTSLHLLFSGKLLIEQDLSLLDTSSDITG